jgi:hypothetical protein
LFAVWDLGGECVFIFPKIKLTILRPITIKKPNLLTMNQVNKTSRPRQLVSTLHVDRDETLLPAMIRVLTDHVSNGLLTKAFIGPAETSTTSKERDGGSQKHHHCIIHFKDRTSYAEIRAKLWIPILNAAGFTSSSVPSGGGLFHLIQKGTDAEATTYAIKELSDENPVVLDLGVSRAQGKRSDLERFSDAVDQGAFTDYNSVLRDGRFDGICARHKAFVIDKLALCVINRAPPDDFVLRVWQQCLVDALRLPADDRTVLFNIDRIGGAGKTKFCQFLPYWLPDHTICVMRPGKVADMAMLVDVNADIFIIDCPREATDFVQYRIMEELKDGYVSSPKFHSTTLVLRKSPVHVVVFMNDDPDMSKLSLDRYQVVDLKAEYQAPVSTGFGPEFSSDMTGDGPVCDYEKAMMALSIAIPKNPIVEGRRTLGFDVKKPCIWLTGSIDPLARSGVVRVTTYTHPAARQFILGTTNWCGRGVVELTINMRSWPTADNVWEWHTDRYGDKVTDMSVPLDYIDGNGQCYKLVPYVKSPRETSRMCFSYMHALEQSARREATTVGYRMVPLPDGELTLDDALYMYPLGTMFNHFSWVTLGKLGNKITLVNGNFSMGGVIWPRMWKEDITLQENYLSNL